MSLLLKKLNQASAQKSADDVAAEKAAGQQDGAQAQPPAAPASAASVPPSTPAPAASATPAAVTAPAATSAQPATAPAPAPVVASTPTPPPSAAPVKQPIPAPVVAKPAPAQATAPVSPAQPQAASVQLTSVAPGFQEPAAKAPPQKRKLSTGLRAGDYFGRARGGIASAARVLRAQSGEDRKRSKFLIPAAIAIIVAVGGLYAYSLFSTSLDFDGPIVGRQGSQGSVRLQESVTVSALPSPAVDIQAQVAATDLPQTDDSNVVLTISGEQAIADYEIVPDVQYSDEEWSLIEREEREAAEAEERAIAVIAASDPVGVDDVVLDINTSGIPDADEDISISTRSPEKVANRAEIKSSQQAVRRAARLSQAADLYAAGRYERAGRIYEEVLRDAPTNLQALRGSALVATALRRYQSAANYYVQILEFFPDDPFAIAELANLGGINPREVERTLRDLLGKAPPIDGRLYFALGNMYAASSRWREARDAFGDALSHEKNPDYAYNLAVSLEYLQKPGLAVHYYQQALKLAQGSATAGFDVAQVRSRISVLDV